MWSGVCGEYGRVCRGRVGMVGRSDQGGLEGEHPLEVPSGSISITLDFRSYNISASGTTLGPILTQDSPKMGQIWDFLKISCFFF